MKNMIFGLLMIVVLGACAMQPLVVEECGDASLSVINKVVPNPKAADILLKLANYEGLSRSYYTKQEAQKFFDDMKDVVQTVETYDDIAIKAIVHVDSLKDKVGGRYILVSEFIGEFMNNTLPVTDYDRCLMLKHIEGQESKVMPFFE